MCYLAHKSIRQDNCFGLALLLVYKIFEQYNNNNNNSSNGNSNINSNNNNNNNNYNNNTISYFVQTVRRGPILLCQNHVNNSFKHSMVPQCRFTSMQNARSTFFTPTRLDVQINYRKPFSYVTSVEPAILINSFSGLCRILKVAFKNVWSFHANLNIEDAVQL